MPGSWKTITLPSTVTSGGAFSADIMLLLTDGSILIHNAGGAEWLRFQPDPATGYAGTSWSSTHTQTAMTNTRQYFASGILKDGTVFAIGGEDSSAGSDTPLGETYNPDSNTWTPLAKPAAFDFVRGDCNGSVLADGRVLLGGASVTEPPSTWSNLTAIWEASTNTWKQAGLANGALTSTTKEDPFEEESWALLPDGSVFAPAVRDTPKAQRYVPSLDKWIDCAAAPVNLAITTLNGAIVYETAPIILLPSGKALAIGGAGQTALFTPGATPTSAGAWAKGPLFPADSSTGHLLPTLTALDAPACLLPSGKVVFPAGTTAPDGTDFFSKEPVFLEYDPNSHATTLPQLDKQPGLPAGLFTWECNLLLLPTGQMLLSARSSTLYLYSPDPATSAPQGSWKPKIVSVPATLDAGNTYTLTGTQINGLSQAVSYGDDGGMATNYPIVRLINAAGQVFYMTSSDFSTMGVATGHKVESCKFKVPANIAAGKYSLDVVANGIASSPVPVAVKNPIACTALLASVLKQASEGVKFPFPEAEKVEQQLRLCLQQGNITQAQYNEAANAILKDDTGSKIAEPVLTKS